MEIARLRHRRRRRAATHANPHVVGIENYERTLSPALIGWYERNGYCWIVSGYAESGRAFADPKQVPHAVAYYRALARQAEVVYRASPYRRGARPVAFNFDWTFDYYPLAYARPGPEMIVYRLRDGGCAPGRPDILSHEMTATTETDRLHLARAIELAGRGVGAVKPNPAVGAVVARDGQVLGEGWHERFGAAHAEVNAIEACGMADLSGATLYVSLEPCCHEGKTPPCTDAIVQAGIRRVVVGSDDPTEKAAGRGLGILRDEGIDVVLADGELATQARLLNQAFRKHARVGRPWVLFKSAMTLDGKVATRAGDSQWISGEASRELAHQWRASVDAVVVGIGTALADDPQLTARPDGTPAEASEQPRRVVFDSLARLPADLAARRRRRRDPADRRRLARRRPRRHRRARNRRRSGARRHRRERARPRPLRARPARRSSASPPLLLEGGPHLAGAFLDAGEIDEIRLFLAPLLLGGRTARDPLEGEGVERISEALRALTFDCARVGEDLLVSARLREW